MAIAEHRKASRLRTVFGGSIVFNNGNSSLDCTVRNISDAGAKLVVEESNTFPKQFHLHIPQQGRQYTARVVWRKGEEVGVEFQNELVNQTTIPVGSDEAVAHLRDLEIENARLKKIVADLKLQLARSQEAG